jgi:putative nucleic acid binding protein
MRERTSCVAVLALFLTLGSACADRLPDQDLRILQATPVAKLTVELLWTEYQADRRAADRKYWGQAIEVSGKISSVEPNPPRIMFVQPTKPQTGIQANLLEERARGVLADAAVGQRITLRCFCEGLQTNVVLKSCIRP